MPPMGIMGEMKVFGNIHLFDKSNYRLTINMGFVDETLILLLDSLDGSKDFFTMTIPEKKSKDLSDGMRKKWFVYLSRILTFHEIFLTKENILGLHEDFKRTYLPCGKVIIGGREVIIPPSLQRGAENSVSSDDIKEALVKIEVDYSPMGVDFSYEEEKL